MNIDTLVRDNIKSMSSYSSARDDFKKENDKKLIYLDANESPFDNEINRYPDNKHVQLKKVISKLKNVDKNQIIFGNGTDEILDLIVRVFCNPNKDKIITLPPTYGMYDVIAKTNGVENVEIPLKNDFSIEIELIAKVISQTSNFKELPISYNGRSYADGKKIKFLDGFRYIFAIFKFK